MSKVLKCTVLAIACIGLSQCEKGSLPTNPTQSRELTTAEEKLIFAFNRFGTKLFSHVVEESIDENVFISPLSVSMALAMTYNGAEGTTADAMRETLNFDDLTLEEVNRSYRDLIELLRDLDPTVDFNLVNSLWCRSGVSFDEDFVGRCADYFDALVTELDFGAPGAAGIINDWVNENTNGRIEEIVDDPIPFYIVLYLIDAIYFKGNWKYQFNPDHTADARFTLPDGSEKPCRMMEQRIECAHLANGIFRAVTLPYGEGGFSMTIFLPHIGVSTDDFIAQLTDENWERWLQDFAAETLDIYIPKFELEYETKLNGILEAMGMEIAFGPGADFSGMIPEGGIWIDEVKHKSFVEINEEGTEAAAATSVACAFGEFPDPSFRVSRPFVFVIHETYSGTILFLGKVVDPVP